MKTFCEPCARNWRLLEIKSRRVEALELERAADRARIEKLERALLSISEDAMDAEVAQVEGEA